MKRLIILMALVFGLSTPALAEHNPNHNPGGPPDTGATNYTYNLLFVDNSEIDAAMAGVLGYDTWYQWIYKLEVVEGGTTHNAISHEVIGLIETCYEGELLAAVTGSAGANSGNLYSLSGNEVRSYTIGGGPDGSTGIAGIKFTPINDDNKPDTIGDFDYFWFSAPTQLALNGDGVVKFGATNKYFDLLTPDCPKDGECDPCANGGCPSTPEPTTMLLFGTGLVGAVLRKKKLLS